MDWQPRQVGGAGRGCGWGAERWVYGLRIVQQGHHHAQTGSPTTHTRQFIHNPLIYMSLCTGAAVGRLVFSAEDAEEWHSRTCSGPLNTRPANTHVVVHTAQARRWAGWCSARRTLRSGTCAASACCCAPLNTHPANTHAPPAPTGAAVGRLVFSAEDAEEWHSRTCSGPLNTYPANTHAHPASTGAAVGRLVFSAEDAEEWHSRGERVLLCRHETSPEDVGGMHVAEGIVTCRGGMTSHAAVVARGWGKPCVCGCEHLNIDLKTKVGCGVGVWVRGVG